MKGLTKSQNEIILITSLSSNVIGIISIIIGSSLMPFYFFAGFSLIFFIIYIITNNFKTKQNDTTKQR